MKYLIVICVLIYFESVASYPYGEEYSQATQPPSERSLQFSNFAQRQDGPPSIFYQNGFASETARPYFDNGGNRASNVPLETGLNLKPVQGQSYDNLLLGNQINKPPVQLLPRQPGFNTVDESYLRPVVGQYRPVEHVTNIGNTAAVNRPQYYSNDQILPPPSRTVNIEKLQYDPLKIKELNSNIGEDQKKYAQHHHQLSSNQQLPNVAGINNMQHLLNNPKLRKVLATAKNKKRYMVIYPNGQVEHLDNIEEIAAQHPHHLVLNSAVINQIRDTLRSPSLTSSNVIPSPALPLYSNVPSQSPAITLKSKKSSSPTVRPPQVPLSNTPSQPINPLVSNISPSSVLASAYPPQHVLTRISQPPSTPLKSNTQSSLVTQSATIPSNLKNSLASTFAVVVNTPVVPPKIPISQKAKPANELPLLQQLQLPVLLVSSDTKKIGIRPVSSPEIDLTHSISNLPIKATQNAVLQPSTKTQMTSSTPTVQVPENVLPLTITEVNSKPIPSNHLPVTSSSAFENKSYQSVGANDILTNSLTSEDKKNKYAPSVEILPKPVAMVSPIPVTLSAPIDLADLFPIKEDANVAELSNSAETINNTTDSESLTTTSDSNALDHIQSNTNASTTDDGKQTVTDTVSSTSTSADVEQIAKNKKGLDVTDLNTSLQTPEIKPSVSTNDDEEEHHKNGKELKLTNLDNSSQTPEIKSNVKECSDPSINQTAIQEVPDDDAQSESKALYQDDSTSFDSRPEEPSNTVDETSESKNPSVVDTSASFSIGSDESSIVAADESSSGKENLIHTIEGKENVFWFTPPTYDEIWNKLLDNGAVTMVYILQMPSQNNHENEKVNENSEH